MTDTNRRIIVMERAVKKTVTNDSSRESLVRCGVITNKGNISVQYRSAFTKENSFTKAITNGTK